MKRSAGEERRARLAGEFSDPAAEAVRRFNERDYRGCVEPLEVLWWRERSDFARALIRVCVAFHQMRIGLYESPLKLLRNAVAALEAGEWRGEGIDARDLEAPLRVLIDRESGAAEGGRNPREPPAASLRRDGNDPAPGGG
jgi:hypothetical protein